MMRVCGMFKDAAQAAVRTKVEKGTGGSSQIVMPV